MASLQELARQAWTLDAALEEWERLCKALKRKRNRNKGDTLGNKRPNTFNEMAKEVSEDARKAVERG